MNNKAQIIGITLVVIINTALAMYCFQVNNRSQIRETQYLEAVDVLRTNIDQMKEEISQVSLHHDALQVQVNDFNAKQLALNQRIEGVFNDMASVKASTNAKLAELKTTSSQIEEKTKAWIKESLVTLSSFEENLALNNRDIDTIVNSKLLKLNNELNAIKKMHQESVGLIEELKSNNLVVLQNQVKDLSQRFEDIKESTLDIILKTEIPQGQIRTKSD